MFLFLILYVCISLGFVLFLFVWFCFYHLSGVLFVHLFACLFLIVAVAVCLFLPLLFVLGFVCLFVFICFLPALFSSFFLFPFLFFPLFSRAMWLAGSWFPGRELGLSLWGGSSESRMLERQRIPELSWRSPSQFQDPAPPNCMQAPVLNAPCQKTSKTGIQTHPSVDRMPKVILSPQTPQNTPPDAALSIRGKRSSSTHQNAGTSLSHQEVYTSH